MTLKASTKTKFSDNLREIAEGRFDESNYVHPHHQNSTFVRMIVLDVISDPNSDLKNENKKISWQASGVTNMKYADALPRNTIIAKRIGEDVGPMFVFPFFPSHLSMPCKPGECMWVMFENPNASEADMAFWFCRVVEPHFSDDINHTHIGNSFEISNALTKKERVEKEKNSESFPSQRSELRNGPVISVEGERRTATSNIFLRGEKEDVFEKIITDSSASKLMSYSAVPRFRKRPGDVVLEGTNNSLVVLGTDRLGPIEKTGFDAGSIDIVVGRGQTSNTSGKETSTTSIVDAARDKKGKEIKKELDKSLESLEISEGDPDLVNDRSRILASQRTSVDQNFGLNSYNDEKFEKPEIKDTSSGDAAVVIKSDKIRLIARSDVEILVTGFEPGSAPDKSEIKNQKQDFKSWASIVIKSNGDIVFTPSEKGVIKLGGDDADLAVLCESANPGYELTGEVKGSPILDTMGGIQGTSPNGLLKGGTGLGTFAKKVLMK